METSRQALAPSCQCPQLVEHPRTGACCVTGPPKTSLHPCAVVSLAAKGQQPTTPPLHHSTTTPLHSHHQRCLRLMQGVKPAGDKPLAAHRDGSSRGIRPRSIRCNTPPPPLPPPWLRLRLRLCHRRLFRHALASDTASTASFLYLYSFSHFNK